VLRDGETERELVSLTSSSEFNIASIQPRLQEGDQLIVRAVTFSGTENSIVVSSKEFVFSLEEDVLVREAIDDGLFLFQGYEVWGNFFQDLANDRWHSAVAGTIHTILGAIPAPNTPNQQARVNYTNTFASSTMLITGNTIRWTATGGFWLGGTGVNFRESAYTLIPLGNDLYRVNVADVFLRAILWTNIGGSLVYNASTSALILIPFESQAFWNTPAFRVVFNRLETPTVSDGTYSLEGIQLPTQTNNWVPAANVPEAKDALINFLTQVHAHVDGDDARANLAIFMEERDYDEIEEAIESYIDMMIDIYLDASFVIDGNTISFYLGGILQDSATFTLEHMSGTLWRIITDLEIIPYFALGMVWDTHHSEIGLQGLGWHTTWFSI